MSDEKDDPAGNETLLTVLLKQMTARMGTTWGDLHSSPIMIELAAMLTMLREQLAQANEYIAELSSHITP
jgi:hypothetical protein